MPIAVPRPMNKAEVGRKIANYESKLTVSNTLTHAFEEKITDLWDVSKMTTTEVAAIHESYVKSRNSSFSLMLFKIHK